MKKNPSKCACCQAVKRCVFKVQNADKQEMLQTKTLLSEQNLHLAFKRYAKKPSLQTTGTYWRKSNSNEPVLTSKVFENITVH
jgi:hypothetical protein